MKISRLVLGGVLALAPSSAHAFGNANAKVQLHLTPPFTSQVCSRAESNPSCDQIDTSGGLYPTNYFVHLLITDGDPVEGVVTLANSIQYDAAPGSGVDVWTWSLCARLELASAGWPSSGGRNLISWGSGNCERNEPGGPGTGVVAHAGYFYISAYSADVMRVVPNENNPGQPGLYRKVVVSNCDGQPDIIEDLDNPNVPSHLGSVAFSATGLVEGTNPCLKIVPVTSATWSRIKSGLIDE
ncbi:MAG TPA: hypothetical protein VF720_02970 [Candidatus Eisenbacteria bacterium]